MIVGGHQFIACFSSAEMSAAQQVIQASIQSPISAISVRLTGRDWTV